MSREVLPFQRVVLDACVLYSAPVRDLLLRAALEGVFTPAWSNEIHEEWTRNLLNNRADLESERIQRTVALMERAFPDANSVVRKDSLTTVELPDPQDEHVVRLAESVGAGLIVTFNEKDFPRTSLHPLGIEARHPDDFFVELTSSNPQSMVHAVNRTVMALKNPPISFSEYADVLERCSLPQTALWVRKEAHEGHLSRPD